MSYTLKILNNQKDFIQDYSWECGVKVAKVVEGPIPPGNITWPIVAIFVDEGAETSRSGLSLSENRETFVWTLATPLGTADLSETFVAHLRWRDEAKILVRRAIDEYWGLPGVVTMAGVDLRWESGLYEMPEAGGVPFIVATSIKAGVEFRETF